MGNPLTDALLRFFGLPKNGAGAREQGIVLIQIDGLSFRVMERAVREGYCPFLASLLTRGYRLIPYCCDPPASTASSNAQLLYGGSRDIIGFSYFDRTTGRSVHAQDSTGIGDIERRLEGLGTPLLTGGSAICSVFSGGATMLRIVSAEYAWRRPYRLIKIFRMLFVYLASPLRAAVFWATVMVEQVKGVMSMVRNRSLSYAAYWLGSQDGMRRIALTDVVGYAARTEIYRQSPAVFVNYLGYDENAHKFGIESPEAFTAITRIDRQIAAMYGQAATLPRRYRFTVFADHGQSKAVPFSRLYGYGFRQYLERYTDGRPFSVVLYSLMGSNAKLAASSFVGYPHGTIMNLYETSRLGAGPMTRADLERAYPGLIAHIIAHPGIGGVVVRGAGGMQSFVGRGGSMTFRGGKVVSRSGHLMDSAVGRRQWEGLARYVANPSLGDILVCSATADGVTVSFEDTVGVHGGFFGDMVWPFMLTDDPETLRTLTQTDGMTAVYAALRKSYLAGRT
jgi:hypothetical protein